MSLCEKCHIEMHRPANSKGKKAEKTAKRVKTSVGVTLNIF
jgi:hypothetical protein